jgi:uncharacterized protein (TIGR03089 family)
VTSAYGALVARLARDPATPWITDIDRESGDRTELSVASAVNGAAKVAHLVSGLDGPSPLRVEIRLPLHWQAVLLLLGCWGAGAEVVLGPAAGPVGRSGTDVLVLGPEEALAPPPDLPEATWGCRMHPLGLPFETAAAYPVEDLALLLREQPDQPHRDRAAPASLAARFASEALSHTAVTTRAAGLAATAGPTARILTCLPLDSLDGLTCATSLPAGEQRSVVLVRGSLEAGPLRALADTERVTHTAGLDVAGLPRLA